MMSLELRKALQDALVEYNQSGSSAGFILRQTIEQILAEDHVFQAPAQLSSAHVTVDPQILIDARVEFAALYECTSAYRGDRLPIKRDGVGEIFERANKMIGRLDAVIADLPKE